MKKLISVFLILLFFLSLQGCYKNTENNFSKSQKITLKMWHIWAQRSQDNNSIIIGDIINQWNKNNPNVQIEVESVENEKYKTKLKTAFATNELPDIFYSWGGNFSKPLIDSGKVLAINEYLDNSVMDELNEGMLSNVTYYDKIYGLPLTFSVGTFYINTQLFEEANIKIPDNYDEFLDVVKAFRQKGITPLLVGEQDKWTGTLYYDILALRDGGIEGCKSALSGNDKSNIYLNAANRLKELIDIEAFDESNIRAMRDESEVFFKQGKVAMYFTGNWLTGEIQAETSLIKDKIMVKTFPIMTDGKGNNNEFLGGAVDYLMVSTNSPYKDEAVQAIKFICKNLSKNYYEFGSGLPAWKYDYDETNVNKLSKELRKMTENGKYLLYWDIYLGEEKGNKHKELVYKLFQKKISSEEFAEEMKKLEE
ncbi:extracellular solute-binding protein [Clostridium cellulovorans]|uniref:Extracellular solute-binding protein family 1 n=1 Tax=Clostridium cellulovorans (strain ATCC 35296 / DSM 3052 / OCM 3 / 743B) TaxID=573061 RepID=D9SQU8_CLOC7|nr:extracellular solute-binding protein [Clostridium cellulovorans]ADL52304.1 extracellular solute-binding protein family 1 [Clostridium cellulovorans 743B]